MELDPVDRITTDAVGEPGERTFYLQARKGGDLVTVIVEKQQLELLSASILEILTRIGLETGEGPDEEQMELESPLDPMWRTGRLSIGYEQDRDMILLEMEELLDEVDDETDEGNGDDATEVPSPAADRLRLWATREQMLALSRHGAAVSERGRPSCRFCGNPMDPEGHTCPAMNGHRS
jgi:uncharacterized repeat protein (TIGR03847 family)